MAEEYRGDSPMKKMARLMFWERCAEILGPRFHDPSLKFLVLCSREAGDVSTLSGMGIDPSRVVACDQDPEAIEVAASKFPTTNFFVGDVTKAAHAFRGQCAAAFLDFCGPVNRTTVDLIRRVGNRAVIKGGVLGFGVMRGREKIDGKSMMRGALRDLEMYKSFSVCLPNSQGKVPPETDSRAGAVWFGVADWAEAYGWIPCPVGGITYHSRGVDNAGVPMMYALARKLPLTTKITEEDARKEMFCDLNPLPGQDEGECLRMNALSLAKVFDVPTAARLLNIPKATLVAWKAVAARRVA